MDLASQPVADIVRQALKADFAAGRHCVNLPAAGRFGHFVKCTRRSCPVSQPPQPQPLHPRRSRASAGLESRSEHAAVGRRGRGEPDWNRAIPGREVSGNALTKLNSADFPSSN
jgi:hypothetical protein